MLGPRLRCSGLAPGNHHTLGESEPCANGAAGGAEDWRQLGPKVGANFLRSFEIRLLNQSNFNHIQLDNY
jgi:hypothetical protein